MDELQIIVIWLNNIMDVMKLLSQFQHLAMEKAFNQLREKAMDYVCSKVCIPLPIYCSVEI